MATIYQVGSARIYDNNGDGRFQEEIDLIRDEKGKKLTYDDFVMLYRNEFADLLRGSKQDVSLISQPISEWNHVETEESGFKLKLDFGHGWHDLLRIPLLGPYENDKLESPFEPETKFEIPKYPIIQPNPDLPRDLVIKLGDGRTMRCTDIAPLLLHGGYKYSAERRGFSCSVDFEK